MFHDNIRTEKLNSIGFPKIKGHVKIRLHNPNTWKTEVIEGDNMITDAVKDIFASNLCGAMNYRTMLPLYSNMFGGVLCFGEQLDVSSVDAAKDYFIPNETTAPVIAHAGQTTFSDQADDVKRGNPLNTSMVVTDGAVTLAWEWGSAAGNGTIKSVGLTHTSVGDAGTGSTSNAFKAMTPNINATFGLAPTHPCFFIDSNGYGYNFWTSGTSVTLVKFPMAYKEVGLVGLPYNYVSGIQKSKTVSVSTSFSGNPHYWFDKSTSKLYLFYNASKSNSCYVDVLDLSDWDNITKTHDQWTSLGRQVGKLVIAGNNAEPCPVPYYNGYVYLPAYNNSNNVEGFLKVNLSSVGDQDSITVACDGGSGTFIPNKTNRIVAGKDFVINGNNIYKATVGSPDVLHTGDNYNRWYNAAMNSDEGLVLPVFCRNTSGVLYYPSISKFYLASKYNLPAPVTKTNAQSMVVTYTLTEV